MAKVYPALCVLVIVSIAGVDTQTIATSSTQSVTPVTTVSQSMPPAATQGFNSNNVTSSNKFEWCLAQTNTCPVICSGEAADNRCDDVALTYSCICSNGTVPDCTAFLQTLPFFICEATYSQCVSNNANNVEGQATCQSNQQCGTRNATAEALAAQISLSSVISSASLSTTPASTNGTSTRSSVTTAPATISTGSTITSESTAATSSPIQTASPSSSLSSGAYAGIGIGATLGTLITLGLIIFCVWKRRRAARYKSNKSSLKSPTDEHHAKPELLGVLGKPGFGPAPPKSEFYTDANRHEMGGRNTPNSHRAIGQDTRAQNEMYTNDNRHEVGNTGVAATMNGQWSTYDDPAELYAPTSTAHMSGSHTSMNNNDSRRICSTTI